MHLKEANYYLISLTHTHTMREELKLQKLRVINNTLQGVKNKMINCIPLPHHNSTIHYRTDAVIDRTLIYYTNGECCSLKTQIYYKIPICSRALETVCHTTFSTSSIAGLNLFMRLNNYPGRQTLFHAEGIRQPAAAAGNEVNQTVLTE